MSEKLLRKQIKKIAPLYGIRQAALFGSRARGDFKQDSDFDILVDLLPNKTLLDLIGIQQDLEQFLNQKVDVVTYRSLHPLLKQQILHEQKIVYERN